MNGRKLTPKQIQSFSKRYRRMKGKITEVVPEINVDSANERLLRYVALGLCDVKFYDLDEGKLVDEIEPYKNMYIQIRPMVSTRKYRSDEPMYTPNNQASKLLSRWLNGFSTDMIQFENNVQTDDDKPLRFDISLGEMKKRFPSVLMDEKEIEEVRELAFDELHLSSELLKSLHIKNKYFKFNFSNSSIMKIIFQNSIDVPAEDIEWFVKSPSLFSQYDFENKYGRKPKLSGSFLKNLLLTNWRVDENLVLHNYKLTKESVLNVVRANMNTNQKYEDIQHHYHFDFSYIAQMNYQDFKPAEWMKMFRLNNQLPPRVVPVDTRKHFTPMMISELVEINPLAIYDWGLFNLYDIDNPFHSSAIDLELIYPQLPTDKQLHPDYYLYIPSEDVHPVVKDLLKKDFYPELFNHRHTPTTIRHLFYLTNDDGKIQIFNNYFDYFNYKDFIENKDVIDRNEERILPEIIKKMKREILRANEYGIDFDVVPNFMKSETKLLEYLKSSNHDISYSGCFEIFSSSEMDISEQVKSLGTYLAKGENLSGSNVVEVSINDSVNYTWKSSSIGSKIKIIDTGLVSFKVGEAWFNNERLESCFEFTINKSAFDASKKSQGKSFENKEDREFVLECLIKEQKKKISKELESEIKKSLKEIANDGRTKISAYMRKKAKTNFNRHFVLALMNQAGLVSVLAKKNIFIINEHGLENFEKALFNKKLSNKIISKEEPKKKVVKI